MLFNNNTPDPLVTSLCFAHIWPLRSLLPTPIFDLEGRGNQTRKMLSVSQGFLKLKVEGCIKISGSRAIKPGIDLSVMIHHLPCLVGGTENLQVHGCCTA